MSKKTTKNMNKHFKLKKIEKIIESLKFKLNVSTTVELAQLLDVRPNTISSWKTRNSLSYDKIITD